MENFEFIDYHHDTDCFLEALLKGLAQEKKSISPKFLYDETGSKIFEKICKLEAYYPTRTEKGILEHNKTEIARILGENAILIEPGCGSCEKVQLLLDELRPKAFVPIDISGEYLGKIAKELHNKYPWLELYAIAADYTKPFELPDHLPKGKRVVFYPGSTIGNMRQPNAEIFLKRMADLVGEDGGLLIGVDLQKDVSVLERAYNDPSGETEDFIFNIMSRANKELGADFDLNNFQYHSFYNQEDGRVEMHLVSKTKQTVTVNGQPFNFNEGESLHTSNSRKFTIPQFEALANSAGFYLEKVWTDTKNYFSVLYLSRKS
ncbi:MAG: L-histidine N(alpha)-methyltransferase [Chlamydiota bacterium]|nr:L-histidine N(alpha)-methyltransferase [Chlamydiota bacterium]